MKTWLSILSSLVLLCSLAGLCSSPGNAASAASHPSACGPASIAFAEPPAVDVWTLPKNALGQRELILAVHEAKDRFCYHYWLDGVEHIGAPAIHVRPGDAFSVRVVNDIGGPSKGERVAANAIPPCMPMMMNENPVHHYVGYLNHTIDDRYLHASDADTDLHLHGFQGPESQDDPFVSTLSTPMHACEYHFAIPTNQPPGIYFYHPHAHGAADDQVAGGLSGAWIVEAATPQVPASDEHVLILGYRYPFAFDDPYAMADFNALLDAAAQHEGSLQTAAPVAYDPFAPPAWPSTVPIRGAGEALNPNSCDGVVSDTALALNGANVPASIGVAAGSTQVLHVLNATSDSPKLLVLRDENGHAVPLRVAELDGRPVGDDNLHPLSRYIQVDRLMLTPSGRATILATVPAGATLTLATTHFCGGTVEAYQVGQDLLSMQGAASATPPVTVATSELLPSESPAAQLVAYADAHRSSIHRRAITFNSLAIPARGKTPAHLSFYVTDTTKPDFRQHSFAPVFANGSMVPTNPDIVVKQGTVEEWYLINSGMGAHSFHIHQMAFVDERGPGGVPVRLDSVYLPQGKLAPNPADPDYPLVRPSITRVLLDFRNVPKGTFPFHCHMLYHEDHGMMGTIRVE